MPERDAPSVGHTYESGYDQRIEKTAATTYDAVIANSSGLGLETGATEEHARTHARSHARTHAHTHTHTQETLIDSNALITENGEHANSICISHSHTLACFSFSNFLF